MPSSSNETTSGARGPAYDAATSARTSGGGGGEHAVMASVGSGVSGDTITRDAPPVTSGGDGENSEAPRAIDASTSGTWHSQCDVTMMMSEINRPTKPNERSSREPTDKTERGWSDDSTALFDDDSSSVVVHSFQIIECSFLLARCFEKRSDCGLAWISRTRRTRFKHEEKFSTLVDALTSHAHKQVAGTELHY